MTTNQKLPKALAALVCAICIVAQTHSTAQAAHLTGSWSVLSSMNNARHSTFVAAVGDKLYVAGGNNGAGATNVLERYDPGTDTWTTLTPMPGARYLGGVAVLGSKIYALGGWDAPATFLPTTTVQIYDTVTNSWSAGPSMPTLSSSGPSGEIGGKIYKHTAEHGSSGPSLQFHVLDPGAGTWSAVASLPLDHGGGAPGVINNKLVVAAGWGWSGGIQVNHAQVRSYDPVTNAWSTLSSAPTARAGMASGVLGDHLLVAGGGTFGGPVLDVFESYDATADVWSTLPPMPIPISSTAGAVIGDTFYVVGGFDGVNTSSVLQAFTIPEPTSFALAVIAAASLGLLGWRRRRRVG